MPTPSSVSRYRPAVLVLTGAAAAYATWLLYTSFSDTPSEGLHRSNAVRRPNTRTRPRNRAPSQHPSRVVEQLLAETTALGEFDFFGQIIRPGPGNNMDHDSLLALGRELDPNATDELIESRIDEAYDYYVDRFLEELAQGRPLSELPTAELEAIVSITNEQSTWQGMDHAFQRLRNRTSILNAQGQPVDDLETIPPTEAGDWEEDIVGDAEGQTLQRTLYHIAEDRARHEGVVHRGITCNGCDSKPIRGIRWHCANCADFDLCSDCEATNSHVKTHIFYKIRVPAPNLSITKQEPLYPGRPHMMSPSIDAKLKRRLVSDTRMEAEEIEALWDQFTCLATTSWTADPNGLGWALDRRAFNHAFIPRYSTFKSAPNLIYDRVFSYFDTDHNTLIGFEEFVKGIDGLHATDVHIKLRIVFNGYDIDGDGYISRKDVLRVFRAHYAIEREATRNYLAESAEEMSVRGALEVIQSAQPLGSAFTQGAIEPGEPNWLLRTKPSDDEIDTAPIIENRPDTLDRETVIASTNPRANGEDGLEDSHVVVNDTLQDRWARRQFYTDEEEGFNRPQGAADSPSTPSSDHQPNGFQDEDAVENEEYEPPTPESERPRWSRSSSKVRFQDDVDVETRSNASTSSRPVGERWGGYEIPEPEKDLGKEVLYQITQQAFNELLDPLFKEGEDAAMDAYAYRDERRRFVTDIDAMLERFNNDGDLLKRIAILGVFTYANCVLKAFCQQDFSLFAANAPLKQAEVAAMVGDLFRAAESSIEPLAQERQPEESKLWVAMLYRAQLEHELKKTIEELAIRQGWMSVSKPASPIIEHRKSVPAMIERDQTFPQFRPNSLSDMVSTIKDAADTTVDDMLASLDRPFGPLFVVPHPKSRINLSDKKPATEVGTAPYALDEYGITLSRPIPLPEPLPHPIMHILSFENDTLADETRLLSQHPAFDPCAPQQEGTFHRAILAAANDDSANMHLQIVALAKLESVDRRDGERKGSGKVSFDEFERATREGRMRFLESWMEWVSF
ncbi:uncharacterized protein N0V89_003179 [Didymosphaeria variabile]|uniref:EF-hand n=1 Tax=Didymosphaeria variabile TaxID=1932322 RepID=A0A9W9CF49_9PLEO|nr:uncharacterized protein N0V89_003179 [Didymosphaeria variabile]KAJ4358595.1 hypothetical protein N0V89_003179 [Didymosphaeria variabile]